MTQVSQDKRKSTTWLLLVFSLPTARASERMDIWRKLQRYGALALPASGYVLPNQAANRERFQWLAAPVRGARGKAAIAAVCSFDELRNEEIEQMFCEARAREYLALEKELKRLSKAPGQ